MILVSSFQLDRRFSYKHTEPTKQIVTRRPLPKAYFPIPDFGIYFAPFAFFNPGRIISNNDLEYNLVSAGNPSDGFTVSPRIRSFRERKKRRERRKKKTK